MKTLSLVDAACRKPQSSLKERRLQLPSRREARNIPRTYRRRPSTNAQSIRPTCHDCDKARSVIEGHARTFHCSIARVRALIHIMHDIHWKPAPFVVVGNNATDADIASKYTNTVMTVASTVNDTNTENVPITHPPQVGVPIEDAISATRVDGAHRIHDIGSSTSNLHGVHNVERTTPAQVRTTKKTVIILDSDDDTPDVVITRAPRRNPRRQCRHNIM